jgi:phosphoribosyl 1,2-cyclic phosphate phosphodiesterase
MKVTFLGTGTSYGVPFVACDCAVCRSDDPFNKRLRCSILVEDDDTRLLVDTTPDLRQQMLRADISSLSAILWTHAHNDHIIGLDDIRPISNRVGYIDGYGDQTTIEHLQQLFGYVFEQNREYPNFPRVTPHIVAPGESLTFGRFKVTAFALMHGKREITGYRFENDGRTFVYATDCSAIPDASWPYFANSDVTVLDALRHEAHPTHFNIAQALEVVEKTRPGRALFTHIAHDLDHRITNSELPESVQLAFDGQIIEL